MKRPTSVSGPEWQYARSACRDDKDHERLSAAVAAGWSHLELFEYARSCHRRCHKDAPTAHSIREALKYHERDTAILWRKLFRESGSVPLPVRSPEELDYKPRMGGIGSYSRYWPWHAPELITFIEQRALEPLGRYTSCKVSPKSWEDAYAAFRGEQIRAAKAAADALKPPKRPRKPRPKKVHEPWFYRDWPGHTPEFIAEMDKRANERWPDRGLWSDSPVTRERWRYLCQQECEVHDA